MLMKSQHAPLIFHHAPFEIAMELLTCIDPFDIPIFPFPAAPKITRNGRHVHTRRREVDCIHRPWSTCTTVVKCCQRKWKKKKRAGPPHRAAVATSQKITHHYVFDVRFFFIFWCSIYLAIFSTCVAIRPIPDDVAFKNETPKTGRTRISQYPFRCETKACNS